MVSRSGVSGFPVPMLFGFTQGGLTTFVRDAVDEEVLSTALVYF